MSPIAAKLKPDELNGVALYYSRLTAHAVIWDQGDAALVRRGMELATTGDLPERVSLPKLSWAEWRRGAA